MHEISVVAFYITLWPAKLLSDFYIIIECSWFVLVDVSFFFPKPLENRLISLDYG